MEVEGGAVALRPVPEHARGPRVPVHPAEPAVEERAVGGVGPVVGVCVGMGGRQAVS